MELLDVEQSGGRTFPRWQVAVTSQEAMDQILMEESDHSVVSVRIDIGKETRAATQSKGEQDDVTVIDHIPAIGGAQTGNVHIEIHEHAWGGFRAQRAERWSPSWG
jgi:hypothetical protein